MCKKPPAPWRKVSDLTTVCSSRFSEYTWLIYASTLSNETKITWALGWQTNLLQNTSQMGEQSSLCIASTTKNRENADEDLKLTLNDSSEEKPAPNHQKSIVYLKSACARLVAW